MIGFIAFVLTVFVMYKIFAKFREYANDVNPDTRGKYLTKLDDDKGVAVVRGGTFSHFVNSSSKRIINQLPNGEYEVIDGNATERLGLVTAPLKHYFGVDWIGIYAFDHKIYRYKFRWDEWHQAEDANGKVVYEFRQREAMTYFFYLVPIDYALFIEGAETGGEGPEGLGGNLGVDVRISLSIKIIDPRKALWGIKDWFQQVKLFMTSEGRDFIGKTTYEELRAGDDLAKHLMSFNDVIREKYGVELVSVQVLTLELDEKSKGAQEAALAVNKAQREGEAKVIEAENNAKAKVIEATADATAIEKVGAANAGALLAMRTAEATGLEQMMKVVQKDRTVGMFVHDRNKTAEAGSKGSAVIYSDRGAPTPQIVIPANHREQKES